MHFEWCFSKICTEDEVMALAKIKLEVVEFSKYNLYVIAIWEEGEPPYLVLWGVLFLET